METVFLDVTGMEADGRGKVHDLSVWWTSAGRMKKAKEPVRDPGAVWWLE